MRSVEKGIDPKAVPFSAVAWVVEIDSPEFVLKKFRAS
jgi:hypothetical protein